MKILSAALALFILFATNLYSSNVVLPNSADTASVDMLNGKNGVYKTYDDFLKGKSIALNFVKWIYHKDHKRLIYRKARYKDTSGKIVDYNCEDFWGFRSDDAFYRTFPYDTATARYICCFLSYRSNEYYIWDLPATKAL